MIGTRFFSQLYAVSVFVKQHTGRFFAVALFVSKAAISHYELYERNPSPEILIKLARVFHVSTDYLLGIEEKKQTLDVTGLPDEDVQFLENAVELL